MRLKTRLLGMSAGLVIMGGVLLAPSSAHAIVLPGGPCGLEAGDVCLEFGDFTVYSLALLNYNAGDGDLQPGDEFYVGSSPGHLKDELVVASQPPKVRDNQDFYEGQADDAYDITAYGDNIPAASGNVDGDSGLLPNTREVFRMNDLPPQDDPPPVLVIDHDLWDLELSALNGATPVFYFNLNDTGNQTLDGEDLLGWMQVILYDENGVAGPTFTLNGTGPDMIPGITSYLPDNFSDILPTADEPWAFVHGKICRAADGSVTFPTGDNCPAGFVTINQHLGADTAAFAMVSDGLNEAILSGNWFSMSVDLRLAYMDNGYEQLFILPEGATTDIPEPGTIALFGAGLLGLGWLFRRRRKSV